jgi:rare lipoprotein A
MPSERHQAPHSIIPRKRTRAGSSSLACGAIAILLYAGSAAAQAAKPGVEADAQKETGVATYYSQRFEGRRTASGQTFRHSELLAAHAFHPFGTLVRVTNLRNGSSVDVKIADRGGFAKRSSNLIIDLSRSAAARLDMLSGGRARVLVEVLNRHEQKVNAAEKANAVEKMNAAADEPQTINGGD